MFVLWSFIFHIPFISLACQINCLTPASDFNFYRIVKKNDSVLNEDKNQVKPTVAWLSLPGSKALVDISSKKNSAKR